MVKFFLLPLVLLIFPLYVNAQVAIWPLMPRLEVGNKSVNVNLSNKGEQEKVLQVRVMRWQVNSDDNKALSQQNELIVSPAIFELSPNETQVVRLVYFTGVVPEHEEEHMYRVLIDDLTPQRDASDGVSFKMRYSLPLAVGAPVDLPTPNQTQAYRRLAKEGIQLSCEFSENLSQLVIENKTGIHWRISNLQLDGEQLHTVSEGLFDYLLPSEQIRVESPIDCDELEDYALVFTSHRQEIRIPI